MSIISGIILLLLLLLCIEKKLESYNFKYMYLTTLPMLQQLLFLYSRGLRVDMAAAFETSLRQISKTQDFYALKPFFSGAAGKLDVFGHFYQCSGFIYRSTRVKRLVSCGIKRSFPMTTTTTK